MRRTLLAATVLALCTTASVPARAEFNVNARIPVDIGLMVDFGDGLDHLAGIAARYRLDFYIYGFSVMAAYDRAEFGTRQVLHGGSLGGEIFFSPMGFVLLLVEDKMLTGGQHTLHRLLDWVNLSVPAGLRVGLGTDGDEARARVVGYVGGELVLRLARSGWKWWPGLTFTYRRQLGIPEKEAAHDLLFGLSLTRLVAL